MTTAEPRSTVERIETLVVDPEDVIDAFKRDRDAGDDERGVLRVSSPFEARMTAIPSVAMTGADRSDADPTTVDLGPAAFVDVRGEYDPEHTLIPAPSRAESRSIARSDRGEEVDEATIAEYHETAVEAWEECVRTSLVDEVPLADPETEAVAWVDVRYGGGD